MDRPPSLSGVIAGARCTGGWIAPNGKFYAAPRLYHLRIGAALRATGAGPTDPWDMNDGWVMVRAHGEVIARPDKLTQPQWDTLGDMLIAAPESGFRSYLLASLRTMREVEALC